MSEMSFSNSELISYRNISPNKTTDRNHIIDTVTIHCIVGQWTAKQGCDYFANSANGCSANYVIGRDGSIGLSVPEKDRSWCSSNRANDNRAITIEVASDVVSPYKVTDEAYNALIKLLVDVCKRNNIERLLWKADKTLIGQVDKQNMTVHRWFANKACPGKYLYDKHYEIANKVNEQLGVRFPNTPFLISVLIDDLSIRQQPSAIGKILGYTKKGVFTIIEVNGDYGKLKSGAGWVRISNECYVKIRG